MKYGYRKPKVPHQTLTLHRHTGRLLLPEVVDLRDNCPPIIDQGNTGSCTGCSGVGGAGLLSRKQVRDGAWHGPALIGSALGLYFLERENDGTTGDDAGSSISECVAVMHERGIIPDADWPYDESRVFDSPTSRAVADGAHVKLADSSPLSNDLDTIRASLAMGYPIQIGIDVYDSFETATSGDIPLPNRDVDQPIGGHAILLVGYDHPNQRVVFRNSWGTSWGRHGYGTLPYAYVLDYELCSELYVLRRLIQH